MSPTEPHWHGREIFSWSAGPPSRFRVQGHHAELCPRHCLLGLASTSLEIRLARPRFGLWRDEGGFPCCTCPPDTSDSASPSPYGGHQQPSDVNDFQLLMASGLREPVSPRRRPPCLCAVATHKSRVIFEVYKTGPGSLKVPLKPTKANSK